MFEIIVVIAVLWFFSGWLSNVARAARDTSEVFEEKVAMSNTERRSDQYEEFKTRMEGKEILSHDEIMKRLGRH